jgi:hypothetical protein
MNTKSWSENMKGKPLGRHGHRWKDNNCKDLFVRVWTGLNWLGIGLMTAFCEHGYELHVP